MASARWITRDKLGRSRRVKKTRAFVHVDGYLYAEAVKTKFSPSTFSTPATFPSAPTQRYGLSCGVFQISSENSNTEWAIYRSPDGTTAFSEVLRGTVPFADGLPGLLIDCGNDRLFYTEYADISVANRLFYSADGGVNWGDNFPSFDDGDPLITTTVGAIKHFHGGLWDSTYENLYVFTGDDDNDPSILWCNDIDDLITDPDTWKARWGLSDVARSTLNTDYLLAGGYGSQKWRTVHATCHGDYIYWGEDTLQSGGQKCYRAHRVTHETEDVLCETDSAKANTGRAAGEVWYWHSTPDDELLMVTSAAHNGLVGTDGHMRLHALDNGVMRQILKSQRTILDTGVAIPHSIESLDGYVILSGRIRTDTHVGLVARSNGAQMLPKETKRDYRLLLNRKGDEKVREYETAASRDADLPNPRDGYVVRAKWLGSKLQHYDVNASRWWTTGRSVIADLEPDVWLDARRGLGVADGATITGNWSDQSGNEYVFAANGDPVFNVDGLGGKECITLDGTGDYFRLGSAPLSGVAGTIVAVMNITDVTSDLAIVASADDDSTGHSFWVGLEGTTGKAQFRYVETPSNLDRVSNITNNHGKDAICVWSSDGTRYRHRLNGLTNTSIGGDADNGEWLGDMTALDNLVIGALDRNGGQVLPATGSIGCVLIWERELSIAELEVLEFELADYWNISI